MKKSSKMILLAAISYIIVEEPELFSKLMNIIAEAKKDVTKAKT